MTETGRPIVSILIHIVAEGLARLVRQAMNGGMFKGFQVNERISYSMLQFADYIILVREGSWSNLWGHESHSKSI